MRLIRDFFSAIGNLIFATFVTVVLLLATVCFLLALLIANAPFH